MAKKDETKDRVKAADVRPQITPNRLKDLMRSARSAQKDIQAIAGGLGAEVKKAAKEYHLHRKAFSVVKAGDKMEPEKLAEFLDCLDYYLDVSGLRKRAESAPKFTMAKAEDEEDDAKTGNVSKFPLPSGIAAE